MNYSSSIQRNDLVLIRKTTRGRHTLPKAIKGESYLVISYYSNSMGTTKYILIDKSGMEHFTTGKCVEKHEEWQIKNDKEWMFAKKAWMDRTYVPVFGSHKYAFSGMPMVSSRDGNTRLITPLGSKKGVWISKENVHDDDLRVFLTTSLPPNQKKRDQLSEALTFRMPMWLADRNGFFNGSKSK